MSHLSSDLLGVRYRSHSPWVDRLKTATVKLERLHGLPTLGNFRNPVKEIFYILLSAKTADAQYRITHRKLWTTFPSIKLLATSSLKPIRECIVSGGLGRKRAVFVREIARRLIELDGESPASAIRSMSATKAFSYLASLPGVGTKSAFCVMMYSLDFDVFPVDVNVQRIAQRLGAIPCGLPHFQAQRRLTAIVPDRFSRRLHIGMVVHGRTICLPRKPKCEQCPLRSLCRHGRAEAAKNGWSAA